MIINHEGYTCISLDQVKAILGKKRYKKFEKFMYGHTMPMIPKKSIKIPEPTEWVFLQDLHTFTFTEK